MFTIYPAIDMRDGKCVRLIQGDYDQETVYGDSPFDMAAAFAQDGASWVHMVDLDGAKEGEPVNHAHVIRAAEELNVRIQVGGGIRTEKSAAAYLDYGIDRIILGSSAISDPTFVQNLLRTYGGDRIVIGIDARDGYVATHGWLTTSTVKAEDLAQELITHGAKRFVMTDISRDGMLSGPNVDAIANLAEQTGRKVIASGGVSELPDLERLKQKAHLGVEGAIVGKALYEGRFTLKQALAEVTNAY